MYFVVQSLWLKMRYLMEEKIFHILPTLMFITAPEKARFKSHIRAKKCLFVTLFF